MASIRTLTVISATMMLLLVSVELNRVDAQCDSSGLISGLAGCLQYKGSKPPANSACCAKVNDIYDKGPPTADCLCSTTAAAAPLGVKKADVVALLQACIPTYPIPSCLTT